MRLLTVLSLAIFFVVSFQQINAFSGTDETGVKGETSYNGVTENNSPLADEIIKKCTVERKKTILFAVVDASSKSPILLEIKDGSEEYATKCLDKGGDVIMVYCDLVPVEGSVAWTGESNVANEKKITGDTLPYTLEVHTIKLHGNQSFELKLLPKRMRIWVEKRG